MPEGMNGRSPSNVLGFLEGIEFPCSKTDLVDYAEDNEAPDQIVDLLERLPDRDYTHITQVVSAARHLK